MVTGDLIPLDNAVSILKVPEFEVWRAIQTFNVIFHRQGGVVFVHKEPLFHAMRKAGKGIFYHRR